MNNTAYLFDLDGTVTRDELLPLIAKGVGLWEEMTILTRLTLEGSIDFQQSFRLRVALLSPLPLKSVHQALARVRVDANIANFLRAHRHDCYVVTGNLNLWVKPLLDRLGVACFASTGARVKNRTVLQSVLNKGDAARQLRTRYRRIIAVGDSFNDIPMFENSDIGVAYAGTHNPVPTLIRTARFVIRSSESLCRLLTTL
jgi:HAD superfamily phosphoserine phosphatase-like hydrolase